MTSSNGNIFSALLLTCGNSPHKDQWRGALMFSLICVWINNREAGDLRRYRAQFDVNVMLLQHFPGVNELKRLPADIDSHTFICQHANVLYVYNLG